MLRLLTSGFGTSLPRADAAGCPQLVKAVARRRAAYDAAVAERDALAQELAHVYPALAEKLADLAARVAVNDAVIERLNRDLAQGATWVAGAETMARETPRL